MKRFLALLASACLAGVSLASPVSFTASAPVTYISDPWGHFSGVNLSDTMSATVSFDTTSAALLSTPGVYPDAYYQISGEPAYISTSVDAYSYVTQAAGANLLYVTDTHPTVDFVDYYGTVGSGLNVELYFQGPKGTLPSTAIPTGFPPGAWNYSFIRYNWYDPNSYHSAYIQAEYLNAVPEPTTLCALGLSAVALIRRRKRSI